MELEMSWDGASLVSQKRKKVGPLGLKNLGNSCYLNSVLQCLTYTPPLANFCLRKLHSSRCDSAAVVAAERKRDCPFCILEKRISRSLSMDLNFDAPMKILNSLHIFSDQFRNGRQEDAHEFLRYVIDACHNTCLRLKKLCGGGGGGPATVVREIFGGALQSQVKCLSCGYESSKVDEMMDISLDVLHSHSLKDALQKFFQPEVLDGSNKYRCESCKKLVAAKKQMSILQAPNILVVQLKRFEGVFGGKIDKPIAFEEVLVLSGFMCKTSKDPRPEYKLFGTIVHSGFSPESGHYYAYIKDAMGRWYCCNDSFISGSTVQEVLSEKVYILFFSRTNQRPSPAITSPGCTISNGVKSRDCNGHEASKILKPDRSLKALNTKPCGPSPRMEMTDRVTGKLPISTPIKFSIVGTSNSKGLSSISNGKVPNKQSVTANGDSKELTCVDVVEKSKPTTNGNGLNTDEKVNGVLTNGNGLNTDEKVNGVLTNGFGKSESESEKSTNTNEVGGTNSELTQGNGPDHRDMVNGVDHLTKISGSKRKSLENACTLLAEDSQSREKVANLKNTIAKEAASVLRSCGFYDKVYSFMSSEKRLRTQEGGSSQLTRDQLRKSLISDSRSNFISQIPESLKGDLIKRLQSFSQEK